jgi:riboflavin biosynthesis pyrimidine reductase
VPTDPGPTLEVLVPAVSAGTRLPPSHDERDLLALFDDPPRRTSTGAHVRAVMLATLDGAVTGSDGRAGSAGDPADRRLFGALRALADVVLVGAGTVRAEGYENVQVPEALRAVRAARGRPDVVTLAVVTASAALPEPVLAATPAPLVLTTAAAPGLPALRERLGADHVLIVDGPDPRHVDPLTAVRALAERGLTRVHAEGGPRLLGDLFAAGAVDELCLTIGARLVGGTARRVVDTPSWFDPVVETELLLLLRDGGTLLGRWRVPPAADASPAADTSPRLVW